MSVITVLGGQSQKQEDRSKAETIARQYQQGQNPPARDVVWVARNYPELLQRGTEKPSAPITYQPKPPTTGSGWTYTAGQEYAATHIVTPTGKIIDLTPTSIKTGGGLDILGPISRGLGDLGAFFSQRQQKPLLSPQEAAALATGKAGPIWQVEQPKLIRQAEVAAGIGGVVVAPVAVTTGVLASLGIGEALNIGLTGKPLSKEAGAQTVMIGGLFSLGASEIQSIVEGLAARSVLIGGMGAGFGYITGGPRGALIGGLTSGLGYAGLSKFSDIVSERAGEYLTGKYISSLKDVSDYISSGGEPSIEGIQEWKGLPEKIVSFITGAKPSGLAVGEIGIPDVPLEEQVRLAQLGIGPKEPQDVAMQALDFTIAPRTGGVAYTKPLITAIGEGALKLPIYFGIGESLIPQAEIIAEGKDLAGFEKGAAERWNEIAGGPDLGAFEKAPYTMGFSGRYGFEKPFFAPETGLTPLVTQTQLTRMGIFPDIPEIPDLTEDVGSHLGGLAAMMGALFSGLSLSLSPRQMAKSFDITITAPAIFPSVEERPSQVPFVIPTPAQEQKQIPVPTLTIPFPPAPTIPTEKGLPPFLSWPSGGGERTFGRRARKGVWIPRTHPIPTFQMVAAHFGIKGFGTRGITGDRSGLEPAMNRLEQSSIAGYGKRGPVRVSNKVPTSYKGIRMRDRLEKHERVERALRLKNGLSYQAAHRRALIEEHRGLSRKQICLYEGKIRSVKNEINKTKGDPFKRLLERLSA